MPQNPPAVPHAAAQNRPAVAPPRSAGPIERPAVATRSARSRDIAAVVAVPVIVLIVLGGATIGRKALSRDEMATWLFSRLSLGDLVHATRHVDAAFLPYYALVHLTPGATSHPVLIRSWSLAAAVVTVAVTAVTAARLWSRWTGVLAGTALALNGAFLAQAETARPGALAAMFTAISTYLLVRAWQRSHGSWWLWVGYAVSVGLLAWTSLFGVLVVGAHVLAALVWWVRADRRRLAGFAAGVVGGAVITLPVALSAGGQRDQISWIRARTVDDAVRLTEYQLGQSDWPRVAITLAALAVIVVGAVLLPRFASRFVLPVAMIVVPPLALLVASHVLQPVEIARYAIAVPEGGALALAGATWLVATGLRARARTLDAGAGSTTARATSSGARATPAGAVGITVLALAVLVLAAWAQEPLVRAQFSHRTADSFPQVAQRLSRQLHRGQTIALVQNYVATGRVAGFALYAHDHALLADLERTLPRRAQLVFPRRVVSARPIRTVAVRTLSGRVLVIGGPPTGAHGDPKQYWAAVLTRDGCRLTRPPGKVVSVWDCAG